MAALAKSIASYNKLLEQAEVAYPMKVEKLKEYLTETYPSWNEEEKHVYILNTAQGSWLECKNQLEENYKNEFIDSGRHKLYTKAFYDGLIFELQAWMDSTLILKD